MRTNDLNDFVFVKLFGFYFVGLFIARIDLFVLFRHVNGKEVICGNGVKV